MVYNLEKINTFSAANKASICYTADTRLSVTSNPAPPEDSEHSRLTKMSINCELILAVNSVDRTLSVNT
jgi:hypothetical protein